MVSWNSVSRMISGVGMLTEGGRFDGPNHRVTVSETTLQAVMFACKMGGLNWHQRNTMTNWSPPESFSFYAKVDPQIQDELQLPHEPGRIFRYSIVFPLEDGQPDLESRTVFLCREGTGLHGSQWAEVHLPKMNRAG